MSRIGSLSGGKVLRATRLGLGLGVSFGHVGPPDRQRADVSVRCLKSRTNQVSRLACVARETFLHEKSIDVSRLRLKLRQ